MPVATVSTAAGTLIKPDIAAIDATLCRWVLLPGDADRLLDARLILMAERSPGADPADE